MEVTVNTISEVRHEAEISLSNEELQPHFELAYKKYQPKVELKGFRKGKVPMDLVRRLYGEAIEHETLDEVANEVYRKAMTEREISPIGAPSMVEMDFKRGNHFRFKIQYDVKPNIPLNDYKGIKVEKLIHKVTEEEIELEIHHLGRANSTTTEVQTVTDAEHVVIGDVQELDETGTPIIGKRSADARFYLADQTLVQEIKDALQSATVGETYRARFESKHGDHSHITNLSITVKKIEKVNLPAFDTDLVKKISDGKIGTPEEFKENMRKDLERYWLDQADRKVDDAIVQELVKRHDFPVPDSVVNSFLDAFVEDIKNKSRDKKLPKQFDEKKFRDESRDYAIWQAKWLLLKQRIADAENITVTDEDIEHLAETESARIGVDKERLAEYFKASNSGSERLLTDKLMAFLKSHAKITEKVVEEPKA
ncbi:MAG: Trigger factor [Bacteroidetes bacterium]|nr:Trigger factor [Bacteroidota bacterium]